MECGHGLIKTEPDVEHFLARRHRSQSRDKRRVTDVRPPRHQGELRDRICVLVDVRSDATTSTDATAAFAVDAVAAIVAAVFARIMVLHVVVVDEAPAFAIRAPAEARNFVALANLTIRATSATYSLGPIVATTRVGVTETTSLAAETLGLWLFQASVNCARITETLGLWLLQMSVNCD